MSTGAPVTEVIPTQHEEQTADDVDVSQTLTCMKLQLIRRRVNNKIEALSKNEIMVFSALSSYRFF